MNDKPLHSQNLSEREAYEEGRIAADDLVMTPRFSCPYIEGTRKWIEWQRGYNEVRNTTCNREDM